MTVNGCSYDTAGPFIWINYQKKFQFVELGNPFALLARVNFAAHLSFLNLSNNEAHLLAEALERNKSITVLDLTGVNLSSEGIRPILNLLTLNQTIKTLKMGNNFLDTTAMSWLTAALQINTTITRLHFSLAETKEEPAEWVEEFAGAIRHHPSLKILSATRYEGSRQNNMLPLTPSHLRTIQLAASKTNIILEGIIKNEGYNEFLR